MSRFFGNPVQTAFVVPDIEPAIARCVDVGMGPVYVMRESMSRMRFRGAARVSEAKISACFVMSGTMMYEWVAPEDDSPSAFREFLERQPEGGFHHVAYFCESIDDALLAARRRGKAFTTLQEHLGSDGNAFEAYLYPDSDVPDPQIVQLSVESVLRETFQSMGRIAAEWDGTNAVRDVFEVLVLP